MCFAIFLLYLSKVLRLPGKSEARSYEVVHLSRKIILANLKNLMIQSETPLRKSALWPPNISADWTCLLYCACHGKCIFTDPVQMSHACLRFWKCNKILTFCFLLARWRIGRFTMMVSPTAKAGCKQMQVTSGIYVVSFYNLPLPWRWWRWWWRWWWWWWWWWWFQFWLGCKLRTCFVVRVPQPEIKKPKSCPHHSSESSHDWYFTSPCFMFKPNSRTCGFAIRKRNFWWRWHVRRTSSGN